MQTEIMNAIVSALGTILVALIGYVAQKVAAYLKEKGVTEQISKKKYLIDIAVNAVEQIWQNENGAVKLQKAKNEAVRLLEENGITVSEAELDAFIEASVKAMNDAFNSTKEGQIVLEVPEVEVKEGE